jgi:hypothetical protein
MESRLDRRHIAIELQENFLRDLLGDHSIAQGVQRDAEDHRFMLFHQAGEGVVAPLLRLAQEKLEPGIRVIDHESAHLN